MSSANRKSKSVPKANLSKPVRLVANVEDQASGKAFNLYVFRKVGGGTGSCLVERSKVSDARALGHVLLDANADFPVDPNERAELLAELITAQPAKLEARAAKVGWVDGKNAFVRHGGVSGSLEDRRTLKPPIWADNARHRCQVRGYSKAWLKRFAPAIRRSSRIQLACALVYAAPLVRLMSLQPFAVILFGPSSVGKSSAVLIAGSLLGLDSKEAIPNWNLSVAGLHEMTTHFNDHATLIDETASADLSKNQLYDLFRHVTYTFAEGADRLRHSKSGYATKREQAEAKGIMFTTSEHSYDAMAAMAGKTRDAGEIARAFNVPALREGHTTIFDMLPDDLQGAERAQWVADMFAKIRNGSRENHGGAFKRFVEHIVAIDRGHLIGKIKAAMQEFDCKLALQSDVGAIRHAAKNFSLIYAGGVIAIEAKVLPVTRKHLLQSIVQCFSDGLAALEPPKALVGDAMRQLVAGLDAARLPEKSTLGPADDPIGFRRRKSRDDARIVFAVKPAIFDSWFADAAYRQTALRELHAKGLLMLRDGIAELPAGTIPTDKVVSFEKRRIEGGKRDNGRWIRFLDPRGENPRSDNVPRRARTGDA